MLVLVRAGIEIEEKEKEKEKREKRSSKKDPKDRKDPALCSCVYSGRIDT